jgi:hypothetical protein
VEGVVVPVQLELEVDEEDADARTSGTCTGRIELQCPGCGHEDGLRFACATKCRRCPWQPGGKVAPILDILPRVPVRHFVVTLPEPWRHTLAHDGAALRRVRNAIMHELVAMTERAGPTDVGDVHGGGVCATHPCGSCLDLNLHLHALVLDGVYALTADGEATFHPQADDPSPRSLAALARRLHRRLEAIAPRSAAKVGSRSARAPKRVRIEQRIAVGPAVRRIASAPKPDDSGARMGAAQGVTVRAGPVVAATDRAAVARLAGYLTRAMPAAAAFSRGPGDAIRYRLLRPFADGTTHVEFTPVQLAQRLRALGPAGRSPRITYHGVLAPHAATRRQVVPRQLELTQVVSAPRPRSGTRGRSRSPTNVAAHPCPTCGQPMRLVALEPNG